MRGVITRLVDEKHFGFIKSDSDRADYFFHSSAMTQRWEDVKAGDAVEFTPELWSRVLRDRIQYVEPIASAIVAAISEHLDAVGKAAKN